MSQHARGVAASPEGGCHVHAVQEPKGRWAVHKLQQASLLSTSVLLSAVSLSATP
jgi:hypothetical protein